MNNTWYDDGFAKEWKWYTPILYIPGVIIVLIIGSFFVMLLTFLRGDTP